MSVRLRSAEIRNLIAPAFCDGIEVFEIERGWSVRTPFVYGDGDGFPVILEQGRDGWRLTDRGAAASQLFFDEFAWSEPRQERLRRFVEVGGATLEDWTIVLPLPGEPTARAVAEFIKIIASVGVLPAVDDDERQTGDIFRTRVRQGVEAWLRPEVRPMENWWSEEHDSKKLYKADLHLEGPGQPDVVAFFVGTPQAAERATGTLLKYRAWGLPAKPLIALRVESVKSSETIYRLQDAAQDDSAVIRVTDGQLLPVRRRIERLGVPLLSGG